MDDALVDAEGEWVGQNQEVGHHQQDHAHQLFDLVLRVAREAEPNPGELDDRQGHQDRTDDQTCRQRAVEEDPAVGFVVGGHEARGHAGQRSDVLGGKQDDDADEREAPGDDVIEQVEALDEVGRPLQHDQLEHGQHEEEPPEHGRHGAVVQDDALDDAHDAAAVVLAGVAHRDQPLGGALGTDQGLNTPAHGREEETHEAHDSGQQAEVEEDKSGEASLLRHQQERHHEEEGEPEGEEVEDDVNDDHAGPLAVGKHGIGARVDADVHTLVPVVLVVLLPVLVVLERVRAVGLAVAHNEAGRRGVAVDEAVGRECRVDHPIQLHRLVAVGQ